MSDIISDGDFSYVDHGDEPTDWGGFKTTESLTIEFFSKRNEPFNTVIPLPVPMDGKWHRVSIIRNKSDFKCLVDGRMKYDSRNGRPKKLTNQLKKYLRKMTGWKR